MSEKLEVKNGSVVFAVVNKCSAVMRPFYPHTHTHTHTCMMKTDTCYQFVHVTVF